MRVLLQDWHEFYHNHEQYKKRGLLAGRFYDANGKPTRELAAFHKCAKKGAKEKEREAAEKLLWVADSGEGSSGHCQKPSSSLNPPMHFNASMSGGWSQHP